MALRVGNFGRRPNFLLGFADVRARIVYIVDHLELRSEFLQTFLNKNPLHVVLSYSAPVHMLNLMLAGLQVRLQTHSMVQMRFRQMVYMYPKLNVYGTV